jgi:hypothetical protein
MSSREAVEDRGDVGLGIQAVQLCGFGDGVDDRRSLTPCIAANEQKNSFW